MIIDRTEIAVLAGAVIIIALIVWFFFGEKK